MPLSGCMRSSSGVSRRRRCCPRPKPLACCSGRCSPPDRSGHGRSTAGARSARSSLSRLTSLRDPLMLKTAGDRYRKISTTPATGPGTRSPTACRTSVSLTEDALECGLLEPLPHDLRLPLACRHDARRLSPQSVTLRWLFEWPWRRRMTKGSKGAAFATTPEILRLDVESLDIYVVYENSRRRSQRMLASVLPEGSRARIRRTRQSRNSTQRGQRSPLPF